MAGTVTHGGTLPDSANKADFYAIIDNATLSSIADADIAAGAAITASKLNLTSISNLMTYAAGYHPKRSIILTAAGATVPATNGAEQAQTDSGTEGRPSYWTLNFDKTTDEHAYWTFIMPDSYDDDSITATIYWTTTDTTANSEIQFEISTAQLTESDAIDGAMGTATEIDDTIPASGFAAGDLLITAATTITGANFGDAGDVIMLKLDRDCDGPAGTDVNADGKVLAVKLEWGKDQDTD